MAAAESRRKRSQSTGCWKELPQEPCSGWSPPWSRRFQTPCLHPTRCRHLQPGGENRNDEHQIHQTIVSGRSRRCALTGLGWLWVLNVDIDVSTFSGGTAVPDAPPNWKAGAPAGAGAGAVDAPPTPPNLNAGVAPAAGCVPPKANGAAAGAGAGTGVGAADVTAGAAAGFEPNAKPAAVPVEAGVVVDPKLNAGVAVAGAAEVVVVGAADVAAAGAVLAPSENGFTAAGVAVVAGVVVLVVGVVPVELAPNPNVRAAAGAGAGAAAGAGAGAGAAGVAFAPRLNAGATVAPEVAGALAAVPKVNAGAAPLVEPKAKAGFGAASEVAGAGAGTGAGAGAGAGAGVLEMPPNLKPAVDAGAVLTSSGFFWGGTPSPNDVLDVVAAGSVESFLIAPKLTAGLLSCFSTTGAGAGAGAGLGCAGLAASLVSAAFASAADLPRPKPPTPPKLNPPAGFAGAAGAGAEAVAVSDSFSGFAPNLKPELEMAAGFWSDAPLNEKPPVPMAPAVVFAANAGAGAEADAPAPAVFVSLALHCEHSSFLAGLSLPQLAHFVWMGVSHDTHFNASSLFIT